VELCHSLQQGVQLDMLTVAAIAPPVLAEELPGNNNSHPAHLPHAALTVLAN